MTGVGIFGLIASGVQLFVPSYALRLVRRFGIHKVGWFLVTAFCLLALLHLFGPSLDGEGVASSAGLLIYPVGAVLLLIGMGHVETLFSERAQARAQEDRLRHRWEAQARKETAELSETNEKLLQQILALQQQGKAVEASAALYRSLFIENPQPMLILNLRTHQFPAANEAALRLLGFASEEFASLTIRDLLPVTRSAPFLLDLGKPCDTPQWRGVWQFCRKDQVPLEVEIGAMNLTYESSPARLLVLNDVGLHRRTEIESCRNARMELSVRIAAEAARNFSSILSTVETQTKRLSGDTSSREGLEGLKEIAEAVSRGTGITRQLVAAGGMQEMRLESLDLKRLIHELNPILQRLVGEDIQIRSVHDTRLPHVVADPRLMRHILVNLVVNARDAMPGGGTITIGTVRKQPARIFAWDCAGAENFVCLSVRDSGCGMTSDIQSHVFEPFFSTREAECRMGLGLASVHGLVRQQSGRIEFSSDPDCGTEFRIFLPVVIPAHARGQSSHKTGQARILLVEPDDRARELARCILARHGYHVTEADSSDIARLLWDGKSAQIDLLVTDYQLSGNESGSDLANDLRKTAPGLKVIYAADDLAQVQGSASEPGLKVVARPYRAEGLLQAVREGLG